MVHMEHEPFINVYHKLVMDHDADISYGREFADVVIAIILYESYKKGDSERFKLMCKRFNISYMISHLHVDIREFIEEEISGDILSEIQREFHEYIIG